MRLGLPPQEVDNFTMGGLQFHSDVVEGKRRIPCFTTPTSPSPHGRPPPQKHKVQDDGGSDHRQFAPWQYADQVCWPCHGLARRRGYHPPAWTERTTPHYPKGYTKVLAHVCGGLYPCHYIAVHEGNRTWSTRGGGTTMAYHGHGRGHMERLFRPATTWGSIGSAPHLSKHLATLTLRLGPDIQATLEVYQRWWPPVREIWRTVFWEVGELMTVW